MNEIIAIVYFIYICIFAPHRDFRNYDIKAVNSRDIKSYNIVT